MSQFLILEALRGPLQGQSFSIPEGGSLVIGRLPECGLPIPQDPTVSRQQCRIEFRPPDAILVHLSQTSATIVNDASVTRADLRRGDVIEVGTGNAFRVRIDAAPAPAVPKAGGAPQKGGPVVRFTSTPASCGWSIFRFADGFKGPDWLLEVLGQSSPVRAVIDLRRAGQALEKFGPGMLPLFPWVPEAQQPQFSPALLSQASCPEFKELVAASWNKDAMVCCGSKLDDAALLAHWKTVSGVVGDQPGKALSIYYWPALLNVILTCQTASQLATFLSQFTWLLAEDPASPSKCSLYADQSFAEQLTKAGMAPVEATTTVPAGDVAHKD
jgi:hypothetical protein